MQAPAAPVMSRPGAFAIAADVRLACRASAEAIARRQADRLADLLQAALDAPFYAEWLAGRDPRATPLHALPITGKALLMQRFGDFLTDRRITLAALREFTADPARAGRRFRDRCWVWESSGSTGESGLFVQDETAMTVFDALESIRRDSPRPFARLVDPLYLGERYAFVGAIGGHFASHVSLQRLRLANPWIAPRWRAFSILQPLGDLVAQLNAFGPTIIGSYPTAAMLLADEARAGRLRAHVAEVWTGGETLTPAMRGHIERGFGCVLRNSYGASEFLPIAWECSRHRLHVNADWVILEPVDTQYQPVAPGQVGHTTLLTNLANHLQPLIRFDIGDRVAFERTPCECGSALPSIEVEGRSDDILVVAGDRGEEVKLLPLALATVLEDEAGVFDFQLRQLGPRTLHLTLGPEVARAPDAALRCRALLADFAAAQGSSGLQIVVETAEAMPLARSGKLARIVAAPPRPAAAGGSEPGADQAAGLGA